MRTALTIAGTDPSGGAGIQADIKTMTANGVFAMSAVTALVAQNTTGVRGIMEVSPEFLKEQIDCVFTDIRPDAVKIGMVSSIGLIQAIAGKLTEYKAENLVVDPVMVATNGAKLISDDAIDTLKEKLFPIADILTPNIPEAEVLSGMKIKTEEDMMKAAEMIGREYDCAVLLKGGHQINDANDYLYRVKEAAGSAGNGSTTRTPTAQDAHFPAPSPPIWRRVLIWTHPWSGRKHISPGRLAPCWIWEREAAP